MILGGFIAVLVVSGIMTGLCLVARNIVKNNNSN
jgi:hypothetical protein